MVSTENFSVSSAPCRACGGTGGEKAAHGRVVYGGPGKKSPAVASLQN